MQDSRVVQLDSGLTFVVVELVGVLARAVNIADIDKHVYHLGANGEISDIHGGRISRYVQFGNHLEQKRFFHIAVLNYFFTVMSESSSCVMNGTCFMTF